MMSFFQALDIHKVIIIVQWHCTLGTRAGAVEGGKIRVTVKQRVTASPSNPLTSRVPTASIYNRLWA
jgi:hypothetical protein